MGSSARGMWIKSSALVLTLPFAMQPAAGQQPLQDVQIVAQAYDRCMATYAVRLTHTAASDQDIFSQASQGCLPLKSRLIEAINAQLPPAQAREVLESIEAQGEPNFMGMLALIRSDRRRRAGQ